MQIKQNGVTFDLPKVPSTLDGLVAAFGEDKVKAWAAASMLTAVKARISKAHKEGATIPQIQEEICDEYVVGSRKRLTEAERVRRQLEALRASNPQAFEGIVDDLASGAD